MGTYNFPIDFTVYLCKYLQFWLWQINYVTDCVRGNENYAVTMASPSNHQCLLYSYMLKKYEIKLMAQLMGMIMFKK